MLPLPTLLLRQATSDLCFVVLPVRACSLCLLSSLPATGNQLAVLRIHCAMGNWAAAEQLVASTQDPAAAFHLARLYEAQDRVPDALRCYAISKRPAHAARLAKR